MTNPKLMKVSDQERERALRAISEALVDGRIGYADFEARLDRAFAAENYVELGAVVVDLPVRAPRAPTEPARRGYLPINASRQPVPDAVDASQFELDRSMWPSRSMVVGVMTVRALVGLVAAGVVVDKLIGDVLPSASGVGAVGVIVLAVIAVALAVYNAVACIAATPRRLRGH